MAFVREGAGLGAGSGTIGNVVLAQTQGGTVMRGRPQGSRRRSERQIAQERRLERAYKAWQGLSLEEAAAWRRFALESAVRNPRTGGLKVTSAYSLFSGYASKYLMVHGGWDVPRLPPVGPFRGDALEVAVTGLTHPTPTPPLGEGRFLSFVADGSNREGVLTELLAQRVPCAHALPKARSYVSLGFAAMAAGVPVEFPVGFGLHWACAVKFVEASSGRQTDLYEIGRATIPRP